ncbi:unnamed protein product [Moneuplotes crassus]|uniref:Uncharacterized protein n=1 Tax=Euplotes crassus TaxID=5936 RepID=A0AAD1UK40_EUPCR|nr:unnamed protein product [Moneuplotes crassus]
MENNILPMVQAWSIGKKFQTKPKSVSPGPGQYTSRNTTVTKMKSPQWTIGTSKRSNLNNHKTFSPGPGNYKTIKDINDAPKYHFGGKSVTDLDKFKKSVPGPGQYNPASNSFSKTAFSFSGRHNIQSKGVINNPGPGTYQNKSTLTKTLGKFGTSQKGVPLASKLVMSNPGPGQYAASSPDVNKKSAPRYGFGSSRRGNNSTTQLAKIVPGPGQYSNIKNLGHQAPKFSLTARRPDTTPAVGRHSPGPGNYNPSDTFSRNKSPHCKFGSSERKDARRDESPGPDSYSATVLDSRKKSSPSFGFGSSKRPALSQSGFTPGPGNYSHTSKILEKSAYYMGSKLKERAKENTPGPGNYNPDHKLSKESTPFCKIGSSQRSTGNKGQELVPGPGTYRYYNPSLDKGPHVKIGSERRGQKITSDTPGPGAYKIPVKIIDVPRYLIPNPEEKYKFV